MAFNMGMHKMKHKNEKKQHTVKIVPNSNRKHHRNRRKLNTPNTYISPLTFLTLNWHFNKTMRGQTSFMSPSLMIT